MGLFCVTGLCSMPVYFSSFPDPMETYACVSSECLIFEPKPPDCYSTARLHQTHKPVLCLKSEFVMMMMGSSARRRLSSATCVRFELKGFRFSYMHNTLVNNTHVQSKGLALYCSEI